MEGAKRSWQLLGRGTFWCYKQGIYIIWYHCCRRLGGVSHWGICGWLFIGWNVSCWKFNETIGKVLSFWNEVNCNSLSWRWKINQVRFERVYYLASLEGWNFYTLKNILCFNVVLYPFSVQVQMLPTNLSIFPRFLIQSLHDSLLYTVPFNPLQTLISFGLPTPPLSSLFSSFLDPDFQHV